MCGVKTVKVDFINVKFPKWNFLSGSIKTNGIKLAGSFKRLKQTVPNLLDVVMAVVMREFGLVIFPYRGLAGARDAAAAFITTRHQEMGHNLKIPSTVIICARLSRRRGI